MKYIKIQLNYSFVIIFITIFFSLNSYAVTKTWDGSADVWDNDVRWVPVGAPTSSDDAVVTAGQAVVLSAVG